MEEQYDPLLNPYHIIPENTAIAPEEMQALKAKREHDTANHIRGNVPL